MSYLQRVKSFMEGVGMLLAILILMLSDESGASWVVFILAISLILKGIRSLVYYFMMARFMVGGLTALFAGAFLIDFGDLPG